MKDRRTTCGGQEDNVWRTTCHRESNVFLGRRLLPQTHRARDRLTLVVTTLVLVAGFMFGATTPAYAMHISEGLLPAPWAGLWFLLAAPFVVLGLRDLRRRSQADPLFKPVVALVGAAVFVVSAMPIPVPTAGTCAHPVGTGLAAILIGPWLAVVIASIALLLQALFLAHGGLSTLGANIFSMGVVGAFTGYGVFHVVRRLGGSFFLAAFVAGLLADWATYAATSFELASALHGSNSLVGMLLVIMVAFVPTQLPLGILEGALTAGVVRFMMARRPEVLADFAKGGAR